MRNLLLLAGIAALSLPFSSPLSAQDQGQKNGKGGDKSKSSQGNGGDRKAGGGNKNIDRAIKQARENSNAPSRSNARAGNGNRNRPEPPLRTIEREDRKLERQARKADVDIARGQFKRGENSRMRTFENGRYSWREPSFQGCPPGLAKKNSGCLPPGQARKLGGLNDQQVRWSRYSSWFSASRDDDWRYDRGYAYRVNPNTNLVQSVIPLLGGVLFGGNAWPQGYTDYEVSPYHERFYGGGESNAVRYADGAMFQVDPKTQMIGSIVGLLTGDNWNVGSSAPQGYDLYNVPSNYRDQYADSDTSAYRYNDGYVYEVDPKTQIVRKIIELVL